MKKACIVLSGMVNILLAGCVSSKEMYTAEGNMVYAISCRLKSADACLEKASEICGSLGYTRVSVNGGPPPPLVPVVTEQSIPTSSSDIGWSQKIYVKCNVGQSQEAQ